MTSEKSQFTASFWVWKQDSSSFFAESALQEHQEKNKKHLIIIVYVWKKFSW